MLWLHLLANGLVSGRVLGMVAVSFSLIFATRRIFHVAYAGIYSLAGYLAWSALLVGIAACAAMGAVIQKLLYERLERRGATHLVILIASLGAAAVLQNSIAGLNTSSVLRFGLAWADRTVSVGGVLLTVTQLITAAAGLLSYAGVMLFAHRTTLGRRMRAAASNPFLAEITRLAPRDVHVVVVAIGSAIVALPGVLVPLDLGLQPFGGLPMLLTATIAMIAGGVCSSAPCPMASRSCCRWHAFWPPVRNFCCWTSRPRG